MDEFLKELIIFGAMFLTVAIWTIVGIKQKRKFSLHRNEASKVGKHKEKKEETKCVFCGNMTDAMYHINEGWCCTKCIKPTF